MNNKNPAVTSKLIGLKRPQCSSASVLKPGWLDSAI